MSQLSEAGLNAYLSYWVGACLRYVFIAGGLFFFFHVVYRSRWMNYRIQQDFPRRDEVTHAIRWSVVNMSFMGLFTMLMCQLIHDHHTSMYFDFSERGFGYFVLSIVGGIVGYDTWIYWQHRLMHSRWFFDHAHYVHHYSNNPSPLSVYAVHPIEAAIGNGYFLLLVIFVPLHPLALNFIALFFLSYGIVGHLGYEFFPAGYTRHPLFGWFSTATHHNMHHSHFGCNYGNWFNHWDWLMGTNHPDYHSTYDAIKARAAGSTVAVSAETAASVCLPELPTRQAT